MPSKDEEYSHKPINKIDIVPMIKETMSGIAKGNTSDLLGLPGDLLNIPLELMSKNSVSKENPVGTSKWFRELAGVGVEDSSGYETAGTMVSVPGLEKAMIVPFVKLAKKMGRTEDVQKYAADKIVSLTNQGVNPETVYNLIKGYAEEGKVKGVMSDARASINPDVLAKITDTKLKDFADAVKRGEKDSWKHIEARNTDPNRNEERSTTLGQLLNHPELYELYPELKDVKVKEIPAYSKYKGSLNLQSGKIKEIGLNTVTYGDESLKTLLHEVQHGIQTMEGWNNGGSPADFIRSEVSSALNKKLTEVKGTPEESKVKILQQNLQKLYYDKYRRIPGEQEARFTEQNLNKSQKDVENVILNYLQKNKTPANNMD